MKVITYTKSVIINNPDIPKSYLEFITKYGYGTYCGLINITAPDEQVVPGTFSDCWLWEFTSAFTENDIQNTTQLCSSIDGDSICCIKKRPGQLFILPRHSDEILQFESFDKVLSFYDQSYQVNYPYFEPAWGRETELFSLAHEETLLDINPIHKKFLETFEHDLVIGEEQPKYVIEKMGGWVKFDLVYKNSISVSYQTVNTNEHLKYIDFIKSELKQLIS